LKARTEAEIDAAFEQLQPMRSSSAAMHPSPVE
jgi:hypothetical protein